MTPEQIETITAIGDALRSQSMSWNQIPEGMKGTVIEIMRPRPFFSSEQRAFLDHWWLAVDEEELEEINAAMPPGHLCDPRIDTDGGMWLSADLFTDAVDGGSRLNAILPLLLELPLHYHEDDFWPPPTEATE
jgi:hypothetical protein